MTHTLPEIKAIIKEFKKLHCPRLGQKKTVLQAFAEKHGLLKHLETPVVAPVPVPEKKRTVLKVKKSAPVPIPVPEKETINKNIKYVEPNWFKSINDPEYFKLMNSSERKASYKYIFGLGEEKFALLMKPHLLSGYKAWCKRENKDCPILQKN